MFAEEKSRASIPGACFKLLPSSNKVLIKGYLEEASKFSVINSCGLHDKKLNSTHVLIKWKQKIEKSNLELVLLHLLAVRACK